MIKFQGIDTDDKAFLVGSVIAPIIVWWMFFGRKKYGVGGMK